MDELSSRARALLSAAQGSDDPAPGDLSRVRRSVLVRIGSAGFGATVFSLSLQRAQAFLGLAAPKLVAVVALAVGGSAVYQRVERAIEAPHAAASVVHAPRVVAASPGPAKRVQAPIPEPPALPALLEETPGAEEPPSTPAVALPRSQPRAARVAPTRAHVSAHVDLEAEMRWVRAADAALRSGNVGTAQGLLDDHAREFPSGALAEEREGLRIVAGCQSQSGDGNRGAARFLEHAPHSLLAGRVRAACPQVAAKQSDSAAPSQPGPTSG